MGIDDEEDLSAELAKVTAERDEALAKLGRVDAALRRVLEYCYLMGDTSSGSEVDRAKNSVANQIVRIAAIGGPNV